MNALDDAAIFIAVARAGSFVGAAKALSLPTSTISRRVAALEDRLKTQLLRRTTRAVSLTDDGRAFAERCGPAVTEIEAAYATLMDSDGELRGSLRIAIPSHICPEMFGSWLLEFAAANPKLALDLRLTNKEPDLIEDGIDLSFQVGPLRDQGHIARRLWSFRYVLCAHRKFLECNPGLLDVCHPRDLAEIPSVVIPPLVTWTFVRADDEETAITPRFVAASMGNLPVGVAAVKRGMGLGYLPEAMIRKSLGDDLIEIDLAGWRPLNRELFAVYPASRQLSPKVRAVIDYALNGRKVEGQEALERDAARGAVTHPPAPFAA
jgi:DNA-binding transcriptional LysR family regulator